MDDWTPEKKIPLIGIGVTMLGLGFRAIDMPSWIPWMCMASGLYIIFYGLCINKIHSLPLVCRGLILLGFLAVGLGMDRLTLKFNPAKIVFLINSQEVGLPRSWWQRWGNSADAHLEISKGGGTYALSIINQTCQLERVKVDMQIDGINFADARYENSEGYLDSIPEAQPIGTWTTYPCNPGPLNGHFSLTSKGNPRYEPKFDVVCK